MYNNLFAAHKIFYCKFCDKSFQKQQLLLLHERQCHGNIVEEERDSESGHLYHSHFSKYSNKVQLRKLRTNKN